MTPTPALTLTPRPTPPQRSLRILIADDHDVMREGTRAVIERQPGWDVCGMAATGREAVAEAIRLQPDIVIMDMSMPDLNGLDAAVQIKRRLPRTEILMFTAHETDDLIREVFEIGVKSFIFKAEAHTHLIDAIQSLSQHKPFFTSKVSEILFADILHRSEPHTNGAQPGQRLSAREREIVQLLSEGGSNKEVAEALGISVRTAETHRASILRKLGLDSIASLVRYAIRNKIIEA
jgi:two-component system, NarL family, response regulator NreC